MKHYLIWMLAHAAIPAVLGLIALLSSCVGTADDPFINSTLAGHAQANAQSHFATASAPHAAPDLAALKRINAPLQPK